MSVNLVQRKDANGTGLTQPVVFTSNVTAGNLIVLKIATGDTGTVVSSIVDTRGNTYGLRPSASGNDGSSLWIATYDCVSVGTGANTITVTVTQDGGFIDLTAWEWHTTAGTWTFGNGSFSSGTADPGTSGSVTTTQAVEACVGYMMLFGTAGATNAGWTEVVNGSGIPSASKVTTVAGANVFTVAQGGANRYAGTIATYYAAGAAPDFPLTVADTSTVSHLDFHIAGRFNLAIADTSTVALGFHVSSSVFTVGPTTPGGSTGAYSGLTATQVTMPQDGTLESVSINWFGDPGNNFLLGVYTDNAGVPGTLLATSAVATSVLGLMTLNMTSNPSMLSGQKYWITVMTRAGIGGYFDTTGLGAFFSSQAWTGVLPTTWGGSTTGAFTFSLYATLNVGVAPKHFPMTVADTSTVAIGFHGAARLLDFPIVIADTSTVALGFHQLASSFTIGPTAPGDTTGTYTGIAATQYTMPQGGTLQSLSVNFFSDAGNSFVLGVYADNAGVPGALLATTAIGVSAIGLQTLPTTTHPIMLSGQKYWLALQTQNAIGGYYTTSAGLGAFNSGAITWTGTLPNPFPAATTGEYTFSFYATLIPGISPFPMKIADTSTVTALGFEGAPKRFVLTVADTSTVAIGFHGANLLNARYIKLAATGNGTGVNWTNAGGVALANSGAPNDVFYLAGGTYPGTLFSAGGTSGKPVTIRRASVQDPLCTSSAGWNSSFDSLVTFTGGVTLGAPWTVLDGNKWTPPGLPTQWGIQCTSQMGNRTVDISIGNCTVRNVEIIGPGFNAATSETDQIFLGVASRVTGCKIHDSDTLIFAYPGNPNFVIDYNYIFNSSSVITVAGNTTPNPPHPDVAYSNQGWQSAIFRWNVVCNSVSETFFFDTATTSDTTMLFYGNVLFQGDSQGDTINGYGSVLMQFKEGSPQTGPIYYYHNTIVDWTKSNNLSEGRATISPSSAFKNNLFVGTSTEWPAANMDNNGFWNYAAGPVGMNTGTNAKMLASNPFDQTQTHPYIYDPGVPATNPSGTPPATRIYINSPLGYDPAALGYANSFKLAAASLAVGAANLSGLPTTMFGIPVTVNMDMNGNVGGNLGAFQPAGAAPPPTPLSFPMVIRDTSTVAIGFHGQAPIRFALMVADTSTVAIGFHGVVRHFQMNIADSSTVFISFDPFATQHFGFTTSDVSRVIALGYENDGHIRPPGPIPTPQAPGPLVVPPYAGQSQPTQVETNAETEAREADFSTFPHIVPPNADSTLPPP